MKPMFTFAIAAALVVVGASPAWSVDKVAAKAAFDNNGCTSCHQVSGTSVGPSMREVAKRYKGKKIQAELAARIRDGSAGRWGDLPHPSLETLSPADAQLMTDWILAGAR